MKNIKILLDEKLSEDTRKHCDSPLLDKDGNEIVICPDCGMVICQCDGDY